jgi:hypothetical protein
MNCYVPQQEMSVYRLLDVNPRLDSRYGRHPKVLSNLLLRYYRQGLLYRYQSRRGGREFYYGMTEKGFKRLWWLLYNRKAVFPKDKDFLEPLLERVIEIFEKTIAAQNERRLRYISELEEIIRRMDAEREY